jgi:hypothetical protein
MSSSADAQPNYLGPVAKKSTALALSSFRRQVIKQQLGERFDSR